MTLSLPRKRLLLCLVGLAFAIVSLLCISDCMRESDQASVLTGVWDLFRGAHIVGQDYYNYEKLYETYWITASAFAIRSLFSGAWSPVLVGNVSTGIVFWSSTMAAVVLLSRSRRVPLLALFCYLSTPTILLNSLYTNPAILSAGFLLLAGVLLLGPRTPARRAFGALFFFIAVGARADAVLVAPLLVWLQLPARNWIRRGLTGVAGWLLLASGSLAIVIGEKLYTGEPIYSWPGFLGPKVFAGYLVFGLGASLFLLFLFCFVLLVRAYRVPKFEAKAFYALGAITLLLPVLYYSFQLWSPRYLVTTAVGVFLFSVSRRGKALFRLNSPALLAPTRTALGALALLLLVIGLRFPTLASPRLTFSRPTLYPTADGFHPMGALLSFMVDLRNATRHEIDHDQLIWKAARSVHYEPSGDGLVHVLNTPMHAFLDLAIALQGLHSNVQELDQLHVPFYAESRTFMRFGSDQTNSAYAALLRQPAQVVSSAFEGIVVLHFTAAGDPSWGMHVQALDNLFAGNEYRLYNAADFKPAKDTEWRPFALIADKPFDVWLGGRKVEAVFNQRLGVYYVRGGGQKPVSPLKMDRGQPERVTLAIQVLPAWMSVNNR